jgi:hypothetical protein
MRALRGQPFADLLAELERTVEDVGTADAHAALLEARCYLLWTEGRFGESAEHWIRFSEVSALNAPFALPMAAHCYLAERDGALAANTVAAFDASGWHGLALEIERRSIRAGLLALEGRSAEALSVFRDVLRQWRELRLPWDEVVTSMEMLTTLGPAEPEARAAGEHAREILAGLGATPLVERMSLLLEPLPMPVEPTAVRSPRDEGARAAVSES